MKNTLTNKEIISVVVISYNSEKTIIETLDSILEQTYGPENIELIISDDSSSDNTCLLIGNWLSQFKTELYSCKLLISKKNKGVTLNINKAWQAIHSSTWIKTIAADDILEKNCIGILFSYVSMNHDCEILFSDTYGFKNNTATTFNLKEYPADFYNLDASEQYKSLLLNNRIAASTSFINIKLLKYINFADERFPMIEDLPLWLKITKQGVKLHGINNKTVYYRFSDSLSYNLEKITNVEYMQSKIEMHKTLIWPELDLKYVFYKWNKKVEFLTLTIGVKVFNNKPSKFFYFTTKILMLFSPLHLYQRFSSWTR